MPDVDSTYSKQLKLKEHHEKVEDFKTSETEKTKICSSHAMTITTLLFKLECS